MVATAVTEMASATMEIAGNAGRTPLPPPGNPPRAASRARCW